MAAITRWSEYLVGELEQARANGQLPRTTDAGRLVFELNGIGLTIQQAVLRAALRVAAGPSLFGVWAIAGQLGIPGGYREDIPTGGG